MNLLDTEDFVDFVIQNYRNVEKIVEIGIGAYPSVAVRLKKLLPSIHLIVTDIDREKLAKIKEKYTNLEPVYDDIFTPQLNLYSGAELIYSIRPPPELVPEIRKLALTLGSDLLIRPYFNEEGDYDYSSLDGWQLTTHKRAIFYVLKSK